MTRDERNQQIESLAEHLQNNNIIYLADIADLNSVATSNLRRQCFKKDIKLMVVKNSLLKKAMDRSDKDFGDLYQVLKGSTSLMFAEAGNVPAKLIKDFRKTNKKPILKGAFVEEMVYVGDDQLELLSSIKSKNELIADVIGLLGSPMHNVVSALQSGGNTIAGVLETLSEKSE